MKIIAIGDPHGKLPKNLNKLIKKNKIEIIICVGDAAFAPKKAWLEESWKNIDSKFVEKTYKDVIKKLCSYKIPVLFIRGNMFCEEGKKFADKLLKKYKNLVTKFTGKYKIQNKTFIFFDLIYEKHSVRKKNSPFTKKLMKRNSSRERKLKELLKENKDAILITHNPPFKKCDKLSSGKHVGSKIILNAIKKHHPSIVLCGHIHEAKGENKIGKTKIYNLGSHGSYKILEI